MADLTGAKPVLGAMTSENAIEVLRRTAITYLSRARVPYSREPVAAAVLTQDGTIVPGVRVESASFSLTIPAALNAITTAFAAGHRGIAGLVVAGRTQPSTGVLASGFGLDIHPADDLWTGSHLPEPGRLVDPFLEPVEHAARPSVEAARRIARNAHIPESEFPVGAVLRTAGGQWLPGVNVEHPDWTCILCAERNALGTAVTFGVLPAVSLGLSCPTDPGASPCGGCRQLIAELAGDAVVWMDRGGRSPEEKTPEELLPLAFFGDSLGS